MNSATLNNITLNGTPGVLSNSFEDVGCSANVSGYKWMSNTLLSKQQNLAVQPYYTCQVIDNSLVPNAILTSPAQPLQGSSVVAPDGKVITAGISSGGAISVWVGTINSIYSTPTATFGTGASYDDLRNHVAVQVSDFINGTYKIDIYFFGNMNNNFGGGILQIEHAYSLDGGVTWSTTGESVSNTTIPYNQAGNIWLAAGKPYQNNNGQIISTVFYIQPNGSYFDVLYQQYPGTGTTYGTAVAWSRKNVDTEDWILHSLDVAYINSNWYVAFSGYHSYYDPTNQTASIQNYSIYITKIVNFQNSATLDIWSPTTSIISALSSSPQNLNSFQFPQLMLDELTNILWILFYGNTVNSIGNGTNSNVSTTVNFYLAQSVDYINFSYPIPVISTNGTVFTDTTSNSFIRVGQLFYILGNGLLWSYILNNIVADVSASILSYTANDTQQSASALTMNIGNQNGQWLGSSPTNNGYQAIAGGNTINLFQGYYTSDNTAEVAPKNIFYIDDVQQNVTSTRNDFSLVGRDIYKPLSTLETNFAFNYTGIKKYVDIFDGSTLQNYNIIGGTWSESSPNLNQTDATIGAAGSNTSSLAIFSLYQQTKSNKTFSISAQLPNPSSSGSGVWIYFYYVDPNNYMRLEITNNASGSNYNWAIRQNVAGSFTSLQSGTFNSDTTNCFPFMFVLESYTKCQIYLGSDVNDGLDITAYNTMNQIGTEVDFTGQFTELGSVAFGGGLTTLQFKNFRYVEFDVSQNMKELVQTIATKAGIFSYKFPNYFEDRFYTSTNYTGTFTTPNRVLTIPQSQSVIKNDITLSDIEVGFTAQLSPLSSTSTFYADFIFRNSDLVDYNNNYFFRLQNNGSNYVTVSLYQTYLGTQYLLSSTGGSSSANGLRIDITQLHKYRILYFNSYMFFIIDGQIVFGWFDNNTTNTFSSGYMAFRTNSNTYLQVQNVIGANLWSQLETFSINPGDDLQSSVEAVMNTVRSYFFSDLFGRMKVIVLSSSDPSNYTYQNQLILQGVDLSDKEYVNQVTVVGAQGITATATDASSIGSNVSVRPQIINDTTITNYNDALTRAYSELTNANMFNTQYSPKQVNNVGSEIYDVVTVINTGQNTSNVNAVVRNYSQETDTGGDNQSYWLSLNVGTL